MFLDKDEVKTVEFHLDERSFSYYSVPLGRFDIEDGAYRIYAASSSRDLRLSVDIHVSGNILPEVMPWRIGDDFSLLFKDKKVPLSPDRSRLSVNSSLSEVMGNRNAYEAFKPLIDSYVKPFEGRNDGMSRMMLAMAMDMPLRGASVMTGAMGIDEIKEKLETLN